MSNLQVVIVTPEETALDVTAEFVVLPLTDGEIGILKGHAATIGRLGYGEMRVRDDQGTNRYYVDGGFAQVANDVISVLTSRAIPVEQLDVSAIKDRLHHAVREKATTPEEVARKEKTIAQNKAQLRMLEK